MKTTAKFERHSRSRLPGWFALFALAACEAATAQAEDAARSIAFRYSNVVRPILNEYCCGCHSKNKQEAKLDLSGDSTTTAVAKNHLTWALVLERLEAMEMPPADSPKQLSADQRRSVVAWIKEFRDHEARRNAGDPGPVLARRLSNAEYDHTVRDLTGVDIKPTREFPVDPANEAGFDNSGESLTMSPALVKKYLAAARFVADHLVLKPNGFEFAPHPVVTETDRDKFCVQRIVDFYHRHDVDWADYFFAAWRFQHRAAQGRPDLSLDQCADEAKLSRKYLATIWSALTDIADVGPLAELQSGWRDLAADVYKADEVQRDCEQLRNLTIQLRKQLAAPIDKLHVQGQSDGSQPLVLWWNQQIAAQRTRHTGDGQDGMLDAARARFCAVFPDAFAVTSRGHYNDAKLGVGVRLLTAGFHLMQGYFRDDSPLCDLVLDRASRQEIDTLWQELNFVTLVPIRQFKDFLFFERAEPPRFMRDAKFDFARPEDKDVTSVAKMTRLRAAYLEQARENAASPPALTAIESYFDNMSAEIRWIERTRRDAETSHLGSLVRFAERAYRRPLLPFERDELLKFYRGLRDDEGLAHEEAIRDAIVSVLMSPNYCYRIDHAGDGEKVRPLSDYELANRLSYFLWSSMPDDELMACAAARNLHKTEILVTQTRRMIRDARLRGLATEFLGNWLDIRRFEEHNSVDRDRFASFTNELRAAMFEEPIRFMIDLAERNGSVLDLIHANHTFVNDVLAEHYGMAERRAFQADRRIESQAGEAELRDKWLRVEDAQRFDRGGLLPMAVFLTKNSPGLRTSPVKRGYWVVRRLLGERIPPPPPDVPELPKDEAALGEMTLAQLLARHRDHHACAGCHQRFDSIGLVFEGYGPIGERRNSDLGGRTIDATATFPNGSRGTGLAGLRKYLVDHRQEEFVDNFIRKLFSYALGRGLLLSDESAIDDTRERLAANEARFGDLIESIVTSPQFLNKRESLNQRE